MSFETLESRDLLTAELLLGNSGSSTPTFTSNSIVPGSMQNVSGQPSDYQSEMIVKASPINPLVIAGFSHRINAAEPNQFKAIALMDVFYSRDGGSTWQTTSVCGSPTGENQQDDPTIPNCSNPDGLKEQRKRFDPAIAFDANGNLYIAYGAQDSQTSALLVRRADATNVHSSDPISFTTTTLVEPLAAWFLDKWLLATGPISAGSSAQAIYVAYRRENGLHVKGSNDLANSFSQDFVFESDAADGYPDADVGTNGSLSVSWHDTSGYIRFRQDPDGMFGPTSFQTTRVVKNLFNSTDGRGFQNHVTFANPERGFDTAPVMAVDTKANPNRYYIAAAVCPGISNPCNSTGTETTDVDVRVYSSIDGISWNEATITVNEPVYAPGSSPADFLPWIDVDETSGRYDSQGGWLSSVHVGYLTTTDANFNNVVVRMATSTDGGQTFATRDLMSTPFNEVGGYSGDFLEYFGLDVQNGTVHALFPFRNSGTDLDANKVTSSFNSTIDQTLTVTGTAGADFILLKKSPTNADYLEVFVNNVREFTGLRASVDSIVVNAGDDSDYIDASSLAFTTPLPVTINAGGGSDTLIPGYGSDTLVGGSGNDTYMFYPLSTMGTDTVVEDPTADTDTLNFGPWVAPVGISLSQQTAQVNGNLTLILSGNDSGLENVIGGAGNDTITGNSQNNFLRGLGGIDTINGGDGNDILEGGTGDDVLNGQVGNDTYLFTGSDDLGADTITEATGQGNGTLDFTNFAYGIALQIAVQTQQTLATGKLKLTIQNAAAIDDVFGTAYADNIIGNSLVNEIHGNGGDDTIRGAGGTDYLYGGDGNDTLYGDTGNDSLYGEVGDDFLYGSYGDDFLSGGDGNDSMSGGLNNDTGDGGAGTDTDIDNSIENEINMPP